MKSSKTLFSILGISIICALVALLFACFGTSIDYIADVGAIDSDVSVCQECENELSFVPEYTVTGNESDKIDDAWTTKNKEFKEIYDGFKMTMNVIMIVLPFGGMLYAIVLGVNMAKAESDEARRDTKRRLINSIIGLVVVYLLIILLYLYLDNYQVVMDSLKTLFGAGKGGVEPPQN